MAKLVQLADSNFLNDLDQHLSHPAWYAKVTKLADQYLNSSSVPGKKDEQWRYTNLKWINGTRWTNVTKVNSGKVDQLLQSVNIDQNTIDLLCVNGRFVNPKNHQDVCFEDLKDVMTLPQDHQINFFDGVRYRWLHDALQLNFNLKRHCHVVFLATDPHQWHNVILNTKVSQAIADNMLNISVVYPQSTLNLEVDTQLDQTSELNYMVWTAPDSKLILRHRSQLGKEARLKVFLYNFEASWVHETCHVHVGEKASVDMSGLLLPCKSHFDDKEIDVVHDSPKGISRQQFYSVARDKGKAVFHGKAIVKATAPGTDARQLAHALMLSDQCQIFSRPELEIDIDDVQCQHGSSVGQIDKNALFYLQARGINLEDAKNMIIKGFLEEVIRKLPPMWQETMRNRVAIHGFSAK